VKSFAARVRLVSDLQKFAERAFIHKLKQKDPDISQKEIIAELNRWYMDRPGAPAGDGFGRPGDPSRFK
jgi:hypothetical protein